MSDAADRPTLAATDAEASEPFGADAGRWGTSREMNAMETLMWRAEADPRLRSSITAVDVLDSEPDWERLYAAHEWATRVVPRFRERVVEPPLGLGAPVWAIDPEFDLDRHFRRMRAPAPGTLRQLLDVAQEIAAAPFDRERPPWEAVLVEGMEGGRAGYMLKMHHSHTDGMGSIQLLSMLHSPRREPTPDKVQPPAPEPESPSREGLLASQALGALRSAPGHAAARRARARSAWPAAALRHPEQAAERRAALRALLRARDGAAAGQAPRPCCRAAACAGASRRWRCRWPTCARRPRRRAGRSTTPSWPRCWERSAATTRSSACAWTPSRSPCPCRCAGTTIPWAATASPASASPPRSGEADPRRRIEKVRAAMISKRAEPALDALGLVAPAMGRLPGPILTRVTGQFTQGNDLQASNVPGIAHPVYMAGARITHMYPFAPLPGCAAMITLVSHDGRCCIGANLDAAAITEPDLFATCLDQGFAEVLDLRGA